MIKFFDILQSVYDMPRFSAPDCRPQLSDPVLFKRDGKLFCVMMWYEDTYEFVPDGYIFYDIEDGDCTYMDAAPAMEYMGMPDNVVFDEPEDDSFPVEPEEDTITLFESCLTETGVDTEAYEKYIDVIVPSAEPKARQFYNWFRQGI